jgi:hypothetical protein
VTSVRDHHGAFSNLAGLRLETDQQKSKHSFAPALLSIRKAPHILLPVWAFRKSEPMHGRRQSSAYRQGIE